MMCMNSSILPANDCSSVYFSVVGIAPVCMIVFGFIFPFSVTLLANKHVHNINYWLIQVLLVWLFLHVIGYHSKFCVTVGTVTRTAGI